MAIIKSLIGITILEVKGILRGSNLSGSNLRGSDLRGSDLSGSDLSGCNLSVSNLSGCNLSVSNLSGCNLSGSDLSGSDLSGSDLSVSNLSGSDLSGCNLRGADLPIYSKWNFSIKNNKITIGCESKTISEWDLFFKSDKTFVTERGTNEFIRIEANYRAIRTYYMFLKKNKLNN